MRVAGNSCWAFGVSPPLPVLSFGISRGKGLSIRRSLGRGSSFSRCSLLRTALPSHSLSRTAPSSKSGLRIWRREFYWSRRRGKAPRGGRCCIPRTEGISIAVWRTSFPLWTGRTLRRKKAWSSPFAAAPYEAMGTTSTFWLLPDRRFSFLTGRAWRRRAF